ncbi:uncharacterized protein F5891DRAFT_988301 [Suillus fuscotomentosus]|uniref:Uncharacterized protein n=1 Tax=Suillus fuscotomentosus TaxID=1912939 RepID=A0AAD4DP20_9AGAM|nr:uncharacterized protein F5891DRAFT_988301 [Suillus fuscotomentosus]KAG1887465.1 hypothetical protein F5891DRAFT_988301 [Suillus fuscotomentosus]
MPSTGGVSMSKKKWAEQASLPPTSTQIRMDVCLGEEDQEGHYSFSPGSLLEPALDGTLQQQHEPAIDGLSSDDRGNNNTKEVNMQVRRSLQNFWNGVHELTCATMRMLSIECCSIDALPVNDHDADVGEERVRAQRRTMNDAKFYSKYVWTVIDLAHTLQLEAQKVTMDCLAWNEGDFKEKQKYMADRMRTIQGMTIRIMNLGSEILNGGKSGATTIENDHDFNVAISALMRKGGDTCAHHFHTEAADQDRDEELAYGTKVLAAHMRLARELDQQPDLCDVYFVELLTLFGEKGVAIQNVVTSERYVKERGVMTWLVPVLAEIATKTSTLVLENVHDAASEIEYRTVIRHEFVHSVTFSLMVQDVKSMRSVSFLPSSLASYFTDDSLNRKSYLVYSTVYDFHSECTGITLQLTDDYKSTFKGKFPFCDLRLVTFVPTDPVCFFGSCRSYFKCSTSSLISNFRCPKCLDGTGFALQTLFL